MKNSLKLSASLLVSLLAPNALAVDLLTYDAPQASQSAQKSNRKNVAPSAFSAKVNSIAMKQESIDINLPHKVISAKRMGVVGNPSEQITPYTLEGQNGFVAINSNNDNIESLTIFDDEASEVFKGVVQADGSLSFSKVNIEAFICTNYEDVSVNTPAAATADTSYYQSLTDLTLPQVTSLQSRPDASKVLYLDYFAGNVTDTAWNTGVNADGIAYANYSYDSDASTFSLIDRQSMYAGWAETAEDYAPFDVNVTTDLSVYQAASHRNKSKIIATSTNWRNSGGVAYVGIFGERNDDFYSIGWTFNRGFGTLGMTNSHESGHQMGLSHDGTSNREYYGGSGNAGPIMGGPFGKDFVHWNKGDYPDANQQQDDIAIIETRLGALADDYGNDNASATPINGQEIVGFISPAGLAADTDVFSFTLDSSRAVSLTVRSLFEQPLGGRGDNTAGGINLSAKIELRDASNSLIKQVIPSNVAANNTFNLDQNLAAGSYFLTIEPQVYEPNEFNSYGNGGYYQILNDLGSNTPTPDLVVESASVNGSSLNAGDSFTLNVRAKNRGNLSSAATTLTYYRSNDSTISNSDVSVGTDAVASFAAGASGPETIDLIAPSSPGNYYFGACITSVGGELNTANNCSVGVLITIASTVDLIVEVPTINNSTLIPSQNFRLSTAVKNQGNSSSTATTLTYYRSTNRTISQSDTSVGTDSVSVLAANSSRPQSINLNAPPTSGNYYYGACVTTFSGENRNNNCSLGVRVTVEEQNQITADRYEPNNDSVNAKSILKDSTQAHSIHELGDEDWLKFTLSNPAKNLVIETGGNNGSDTRLWLYDSNTNELEFNDDGGQGAYSKISVNTILATGTYYIQVDEFNNDSLIADYTVKLSFDSTQVDPAKEEPFCLPVKASNGNLVLVCL